MVRLPRLHVYRSATALHVLSLLRCIPRLVEDLMTDLAIEIERVVDRRAAADRIRHLEAQVDALWVLIALLERKLGERAAEEGR